MRSAAEIMDAALDREHSGVYVLFSGGHDSLVSTHVAMSHIEGATVAHLNTGIGIPETREFVRSTCKAQGWPLVEFKAADNTRADGTPDPQIFEDIVVAHGFPGPQQHKIMFARLKERSLSRLERQSGANPKKPVIFVSGVRKEESSRRFQNVEEIQVRGRVVWCAPLTWWTKQDCYDYMQKHDLPKNPVVEKLCMSGECLCGAFAAGEAERKELKFWYPEVEAEISRIEEKVIAAGFPWKWHEAPPDWWAKLRAAQRAGQTDAFDALRDQVLKEQGFMPLCTSCDVRFEAQTSPDSRGGAG